MAEPEGSLRVLRGHSWKDEEDEEEEAARAQGFARRNRRQKGCQEAEKRVWVGRAKIVTQRLSLLSALLFALFSPSASSLPPNPLLLFPHM